MRTERGGQKSDVFLNMLLDLAIIYTYYRAANKKILAEFYNLLRESEIEKGEIKSEIEKETQRVRQKRREIESETEGQTEKEGDKKTEAKRG